MNGTGHRPPHRAPRPPFRAVQARRGWGPYGALGLLGLVALLLLVVVPRWRAPAPVQPEAGSTLPLVDQLKEGGDVSFRGLRPGTTLQAAEPGLGTPVQVAGGLANAVVSLGEATWKVVATTEPEDGADRIIEVEGWRETPGRNAARWLLQSVVEAMTEVPSVHRVARGHDHVQSRALLETEPGQVIPPVVNGVPLDEYVAWSGAGGRALVAGRTGSEVVIIETSRWRAPEPASPEE